MASAPKPLIGARDRSVAGSARESAQFTANPDFSYVPGYSDKRRQIAADTGRGLAPSTGLTHRLHWARHARPGGAPDSDVMGFASRGYFVVKQDNLASLGIEMPMQAALAADGSIRIGDLVLMACPAAKAEANEAQVRRAIDSQASDDQTSAALHSAGRDLDRAGGLTQSHSESRMEITKGA